MVILVLTFGIKFITSLTQSSIAWLQVYSRFMGKVSTLAHSLLELGCQYYSFLDQAMEEVEHGLDSTFMIPSRILNWMHPFMSLILMSLPLFHCLISILSDSLKLKLVPSIQSCKLWCQARTLLISISLAGKMLASKFIHYFSSYTTASWFWASTLLITLFECC